MTVSFDPNVLLAYYQVKSGEQATALSSLTTSVATTTAPTHPTAPWSTSTSTTTGTTSASSSGGTASTSVNSLVQSLIAGNKIVNPTAAKLNVTTSNGAANSDYKNLFALYQGLTSLQSLVTAAGSGSVPSSQLSQIEQAFQDGLGQVRSFVTSGPFQEFQVSDGTVSTSDQTSSGTPEETDTYTTQPLSSGSPSDAVAAFQGDVQFSMTVSNTAKHTTQTVNFDLDDMGSETRSMSNVVSYMNSQLQAAGVDTRFADDRITSQPQTVMVGGKSVTLPADPDQFALQINGSPLEQISFSASGSTPAVYVGQTSTTPGVASGVLSSSASATTTTAAATTSSTSSTTTAATTGTTASQLLKLSPSASASTAPTFNESLPSGATVQATATGPDGSVYVLADVDGSVDGQTISGTQDVALMKYDSAGNLVYTRTLGAASTASGYTLAVSPDGSQVAVAGSVQGSLDPTDTLNANSTTDQSFVAAYDTAQGNQLWTQTEDAGDDNQVNAVAFGSDNEVYVAGTTQSALPGDASQGGQDAYLQGIKASYVTDPTTGEQVWTAVPQFTTEFGTSGVDRATGLAVSGSSVYVSSVENGDAVVRRYDTGSSGAPTLGAVQNLGALDGGNLAGITVGANGSVLVAGTTHNGSLNAGTTTAAYTGGESAFVAQLSSDLQPTDGESLAYFSAGNNTTATALTASGGEVYITGQVATGGSDAAEQTSELGYAAEIDPTTGQVAWSQEFGGSQGNAAPDSIAVGAKGSSVLDQLGLPQGTIDFTPNDNLVANTSLQAGDEFYVQVGSQPAQAVTIAADDTYATLAQKIERATGSEATAKTTVDSSGNQELQITSTYPSTQIRIEAGPSGRNALTGLGLKEGLLTTATTFTAALGSNTAATGTTAAASSNSLKQAYVITLPSSLSLNSTSDIAAAKSALTTAIADVQNIYYDMITPQSTTASKSSTTGGNTSLAAYYSSQAAAYASALARLTGS